MTDFSRNPDHDPKPNPKSEPEPALPGDDRVRSVFQDFGRTMSRGFSKIVIHSAEMTSVISRDAQDAVRETLVAHGVNDPLTLAWIDNSIADLNQAIPKSREYGSAELHYLGELMNSMHAAHPGEHMAYEAAILFYVLGKVGRWVSAHRRGQQVSDDTLLDITTYSMMVRLIRARNGQWV